MPGKFIIKRTWNDAIIKVESDNNGISIEVSIDSLERQLEEELIRMLPNLTMSFKSSTINECVRNAFRDAFAKVTREMKEETVRTI